VCLVRRDRLAHSQLLWTGVRHSRRCSPAIMQYVPQSVFISSCLCTYNEHDGPSSRQLTQLDRCTYESTVSTSSRTSVKVYDKRESSWIHGMYLLVGLAKDRSKVEQPSCRQQSQKQAAAGKREGYVLASKPSQCRHTALTSARRRGASRNERG